MHHTLIIGNNSLKLDKTIGIREDSSIFSKLTRNHSNEVVAQIYATHSSYFYNTDQLTSVKVQVRSSWVLIEKLICAPSVMGVLVRKISLKAELF